MKQTLTTNEELKHLASSDNPNELTRRLARELLANRGALPSCSQLYEKAWKDGYEVGVLTAPPAPAVPDERAAFNAWNNEDNLPIAGVPAKNAAWLAWQARALLAQPVSQRYKLNSPETPDGWKIVPVEPTRSMCNAGREAIRSVEYQSDIARTVYKEMLAAAPEGGNDA